MILPSRFQGAAGRKKRIGLTLAIRYVMHDLVRYVLLRLKRVSWDP